MKKIKNIVVFACCGLIKCQVYNFNMASIDFPTLNSGIKINIHISNIEFEHTYEQSVTMQPRINCVLRPSTRIFFNFHYRRIPSPHNRSLWADSGDFRLVFFPVPGKHVSSDQVGRVCKMITTKKLSVQYYKRWLFIVFFADKILLLCIDPTQVVSDTPILCLSFTAS
ncbi:hypothetical protein QTP88_014803 [Uroleucon formosanum]